MNIDNIFFRKAEDNDRDQIANVLLDFYNMENAKEAVNIDNGLILVTKKIDYSYKELAD